MKLWKKNSVFGSFYSSYLMQFMSRNFVLAKNRQSTVCYPLKVSLERKCIWFEFMFLSTETIIYNYEQEKKYIMIFTGKTQS